MKDFEASSRFPNIPKYSPELEAYAAIDDCQGFPLKEEIQDYQELPIIKES
jgi:hypothetical protein